MHLSAPCLQGRFTIKNSITIRSKACQLEHNTCVIFRFSPHFYLFNKYKAITTIGKYHLNKLIIDTSIESFICAGCTFQSTKTHQ